MEQDLRNAIDYHTSQMNYHQQILMRLLGLVTVDEEPKTLAMTTLEERGYSPQPYDGPHQLHDRNACMIQGVHFHGNNPDNFMRPEPGEHWRIGDKCLVVANEDGKSYECLQHRFGKKE